MIGEVILKNKLFSGESINIEYKVEMPKKSEKYMKTVVAFANGRGGRIVFGVDDKTIIVVEIHPGPMRPYYIKNKGLVDGTYVRVAGTSRHAEGYMLKELILEGQNRYFDNEPCEYLEINEDDIKDLCDKMKKIAIENTWNDEEKAAIRDVTKNILITWGILKEDNGKIIPTNAYALLTGKMQIQPTIQCAVFKGKTRAYFVDRREFSGPIQDQVQLAFQYVLEKINMGMQIKGIYRQDVYELPINSVRELIANAVAHRNYLEPGNIQVAIFDDRLEVTSPGMLLNTVSIKKMIEGYSRLRNPAIANAFAYMKIIEKWGTGIPRILRECKEYGLKKPELIDFDGDFRVNMYRREEKSKTTQTTTQTTTQITTQTTIKLTKNDHEILQVIQNNPALSQKEIAMELGWTVDRVKYYLNKMKKQEAIRRIGSSHKGYWELLIKL